ncbi:MAG: hemolysin III family protein [Pirellulales bacterium]
MNTTVTNAYAAAASQTSIFADPAADYGLEANYGLEARNAQGLTAEEEIANSITHGLGFVLSILGAFIMVDAFSGGDGWRVAGCAIFVTSMIAVYGMSTLSHVLQTPKLRSLFRAIDQGTIYLLIAGTYTPFSLAYLHAMPWWILLGAIWAVAIYGFTSKVLFAHRVDNVSMWPCIVCGALPFVAIPTLLTMLPLSCLVWMMLGVVCYLLGLVFWINDRKVRHFHAMWHMLVMAGSAAHFSGVLLFVVLPR